MAIKGSSKKTVKPPDMVRRILRGKLAGQTTVALARAEGVHRDTVLRILTLPEVRERMECARQRIVSETEPMTKRLVDIAMGRKKGDWRALVETLKGVGVLTSKQEIQDSSIPQQRTYDYPRVAFFHKFGRWPTLEEAKEFDKTLDVEPLIKKSAQLIPDGT